MGKSVNQGDLGLPRGRHCYEGDWFKMREPPSKWGSVGNYVYDVLDAVFQFYLHFTHEFPGKLFLNGP